ncbi:C2H2-type domain-containing protein [Caenorhabditis elegans]|uniref:C2H2-type domain-containing protein n=1 Tax=Caenorhabditis elegans TaxID=6239 RepID=Q9N3C6_CAEEL|nr:C2H2-type domain-containing protein [Caenorhabditis elegans]CCD72994.1 C2H2-type domain-containing protein [Caenorhabditis elegans]|eukprot:NP_491096.1 Zinc finger putative Transcription Factor family [Caenorhabditis elegans]
MIGYPIVFRCCECTVEEQTMEHLESHIWSRHLQAFPFKCAYCDFPALSAISLMDHFAQNHSDVAIVEFKRNLEDEKRFRKMVADSIAIEIDETSQQDSSTQMTVLQPMMQQGTAQMILLPPEGSQYDEIVDHRGPDEDDFGVLDDDENIEELIDDDDDDDYIDELGNPVFIGAHDDSDYILEDDLSPQGPIRSSNNYHLKYIRTRRMDKLIDNVVVNATQRDSPEQEDCSTSGVAFADGQTNSGKMGRFSCDRCSRTFKYQSKLDEHRRTHLGVKPFQCHYCTRQFSQRGALKTHMRLHTGERPFVCQWECGKQFASSSAKSHHEKTHSGERPYICNVCGKSFTKNSHVIRHLKNIHNRELAQQDAMLRGDDVQSTDESLNIGSARSQMSDIEPRGKEIGVVHDIVEQIHEERKDFMRL